MIHDQKPESLSNSSGLLLTENTCVRSEHLVTKSEKEVKIWKEVTVQQNI